MRLSIALLVAALAVVSSQDVIPRAKARTLQRRRLSLQAAAVQDCEGQTARCTDCSTLLQCTRLGSIYRPLRTTACPTATPYCSEGACVATLPNDSCLSAPTPTSSFVCNGDGYYPDPSNCRRYWMCVGSSAYQYTCDNYSGTVYSQRRAMCVPSSEATCSTVSCTTALVGAYQRYAADPEVYVVCRDTVAANALVAVCPANHAVDTETGDCVLTCMAEGRLPDATNNTRYYECVRTGTNTYTQPLLLLCPSGSTFSEAQQRCLTGREDAAQTDTSTTTRDYNETYFAPDANIPESQYDVPTNLLIGAASAAYQVEGAWNDTDKAPSIMDVFYHSRPNMDNGDVADDSFHKYMDDIQMLTDLQLQFYRFSISWPRLLPQGDSSNPSPNGLQYYNNLIDALVAANIRPVVTLYHWDLPQTLQNNGGWLNAAIQDQFVDYASYCFENFGDRVKDWIIMNEPMTQCVYGYDYGGIAPGVSMPGEGAYLCSHNMVLAHAKTYRAYKANFDSQGGRLGSAINIEYPEPASSRPEDVEAAERYRQWRYSWFADPLYFGDYPAEMRRRIDALSAAEGRNTSRLPSFTAEERTILRGAMDFLGLNLYTATVVADRVPDTVESPSYDNDIQATVGPDTNWIQSARASFPVTPWALGDMARWLQNRYSNFPVWVTESGYAGDENEGTTDPQRSGYYSGYMRGLMQAINRDGCNVIAYTCWSLEDNLEWGDGYSVKFGLVYVDFNDPDRPRRLKDSSSFIQSVMSTRHVSYVRAT